jgi:hypothetical protein
MHLSQDNYPKELPIEKLVSNALFDGDLHCGYLKHTTHPASSNGDSIQTTGAVRASLYVILYR